MISKIPKFLQQLFSKSVEFRIKTKEKVEIDDKKYTPEEISAKILTNFF